VKTNALALIDEAQNADMERSLSIRDFCALEDMSQCTYHKLKRLGLGPQELRFPGMSFVRVTAAARREWHARMDELRKEQAAKQELERRSAMASRAGKLAAASPLHVSKRRRSA
jgi:hypothetical protein